MGDVGLSLYADDKALYIIADIYLDLILKLRSELEVGEQCSNANRLTLNSKKTKYMLFGT